MMGVTTTLHTYLRRFLFCSNIFHSTNLITFIFARGNEECDTHFYQKSEEIKVWTPVQYQIHIPYQMKIREPKVTTICFDIEIFFQPKYLSNKIFPLGKSVELSKESLNFWPAKKSSEVFQSAEFLSDKLSQKRSDSCLVLSFNTKHTYGRRNDELLHITSISVKRPLLTFRFQRYACIFISGFFDGSIVFRVIQNLQNLYCYFYVDIFGRSCFQKLFVSNRLRFN